MNYVVSITSQGQMSIPAPIRRRLGLQKRRKAIVSIQAGQMVVKPVKSFLELGGSLHPPKKRPRQPLHDAFANYLAREAVGEDV